MYLFVRKVFNAPIIAIMVLCLMQGSRFIDAQGSTCEADNQYSWSYHGTRNGPRRWERRFPRCDNLRYRYQSPIDIYTPLVANGDFEPLSFDNFAKPITKATVKNVGWTIMVTPEDGENRYITFNDDDYMLKEIRFHFGTRNNPGAEHMINGVRNEMEIQFATQKADTSYLFLARMVKVGEDNAALDPIADIVSDIMYREDSTELQSDLNIGGLLPQDPAPFYYYRGSNSTPPCEPNFRWIVLKDIGSIGSDQLDKFNVAYEVGEEDASDNCRMGPNYRPQQSTGVIRVISSQDSN